MHRKSRIGFTLIELLIVVAIIAILAAIAVPNFLEAQTRSKVTRCKADLRTYSTALESYFVDYKAYPVRESEEPAAPAGMLHNAAWGCIPLSTPVAYLTSAIISDPFKSAGRAQDAPEPFDACYLYNNYQSTGSGSTTPKTWGDRLGTDYDTAIMFSYGPYEERVTGFNPVRLIAYHLGAGGIGRNPASVSKQYYDPTNGTISIGAIIRISGETFGLPQSQ